MGTKIRVIGISMLLVLLVFGLPSVFAESGVTEDALLIGCSQGLTGPMAFIANQNTSGVKLMIDEINNKGGIHGRKIKLLIMDDGYRSDRHIANIRRMIENDKVFGFVMSLGTHTVASSLPLLNQYQVPLFFCATESKIFNSEPYVFGLKASYRQMMIQGIKYMMQQKGKKKIAVVYWDNAFGQEHIEAGEEYMAAVGQKLVAKENYKDEDYDMSPIASRLKRSGADCVALGASISSCAKIIKAMHNIGYNPDILGPLMLASPGFIELAGKDAEGVYIMLPFLTPDDKAVSSFKEIAKRAYPDKPWDNNIMSGMEYAYCFAEVAKRAGKDLTREKAIKAVEGMSDQNFNNPFSAGSKFEFGAKQHRAGSSIIIGHISKGQVERTDWIHWENMPVPK